MKLSSPFAERPVVAVKGRGLRWLVVLSVLVLSSLLALAQEATLVGTVTDQSGAAVANAAITVTNTDTGLIHTLTTSADGQYVVPDLHIGHYTVKAAAAGFAVAERTGITLNVGDRLRVDLP